MYVRNKYIYMQNKGWDVDIFSVRKGKVYILDLQKFNHNIIPELGYYVFLFPTSIQERIINKIIETINIEQFDEIIIESSSIIGSTWAEMLAQRIGAKHLLFNLQEQDVIRSKTIIHDFLIFKHKRHELVGIAEQSLYNLFLSFHPINIEESYHLPAHCNNVVDDIECPLLQKIDKTRYDYIVGCLSRIDKPFIMPALHDFIAYANKHTNKNYLLLMIGGEPEGSLIEQKIRKLFKPILNVEVIITGYMFPVPTELLDICNAFFTSAGSSWACMRSGIPTISYDANDHHPIGILGRTTQNSLMRAEDEPIQDFSELMDDILERNIYVREPKILQIDKPDFSSHDKFISLMSSKKEYFCFNNYNGTQMGIEENLLSYILRVIGADNFTKLKMLIRRSHLSKIVKKKKKVFQ